MIYIAIASIILMAFFSFKVGKRWSYPPFVFSAVWVIYLSMYLILGGSYYEISTAALSVYVVGCFAFVLSGLVCYLSMQYKTDKLSFYIDYKRLNYFMLISIFVLILVMPFYIKEMLSMSYGFKNIWYGIRSSSVRNEVEANNTIDLLDNAVPLSNMIAFVSFYHLDRSRKSKWIFGISIALAMVFNIMTAGRVGITYVALGLVGIQGVKQKRLPVKVMLISIAMFIAMFSMVAMLVGKGSVDANASLVENIPALRDNLVHYSLGGLVAFDYVANNPRAIPASWDPFRVLKLAANKFGADIDVPPLHVEFVYIGNGSYTNVYTIYFAYLPNYGMAGVIIFISIVSFGTTMVYLLAIKGFPHAVIIFAFLFGALCLSGFSEGFFLNMDPLLKAFLLTCVLYGLPLRIRSREYASAVS